jgi:hypothetical protein
MNIARKCRFPRPRQWSCALEKIDVRFCIYFGVEHTHQPALLDKTAHLALRIIEVSESTGPGWTGDHTGRFEISLYAMPTKIALVGDVLYGMAETGPIGTSRYTISTIDAALRIYQNQSVFGLVGCSRNRACCDTGGLITLHAVGRLEMYRPVRISVRLFYPIPAVVRGDAILKLT